MKVLFLDIDGVLNHNRHLKSLPPAHFYEALDEAFVSMILSDRVEILNEIFNADPDLKLVLSTAWRHVVPGGPPKVLNYLELAGFLHGNRYLDKTPRKMSSSRSQEIHLWMSDHPEVTHAVVIDDLPCVVGLQSYPQPYLIINTDDEYGLLPYHKKTILEFLGS